MSQGDKGKDSASSTGERRHVPAQLPNVSLSLQRHERVWSTWLFVPKEKIPERRSGLGKSRNGQKGRGGESTHAERRFTIQKKGGSIEQKENLPGGSLVARRKRKEKPEVGMTGHRFSLG